MRLIDADKIVEVAVHAYNEWNKAMAAAEGREINRCFKMQELCKAVKAVTDDCPTIDPESLRPTAHWIVTKTNVCGINRYECSSCGAVRYKASARHLNYCQDCGKRMVNDDD